MKLMLYSKLRTYLSIQLSELKTKDNFFKDINPDNYDIKKVLYSAKCAPAQYIGNKNTFIKK